MLLSGQADLLAGLAISYQLLAIITLLDIASNDVINVSS